MKDALIVTAMSVVPKHATASLMGRIARLSLPRWLHRLVVRAYVAFYKVNLDDCADPDLAAYPSLSHFFVRALKDGVRPVDPEPQALVSPVDGKVATVGTISDGRFAQAVGMWDRLDLLLGPGTSGRHPMLPDRYEGGSYAVIYLSPQDYHRVHSPLDGHLDVVRYLPGKLWPVMPAATRKVRELFGRNERLVFGLHGVGHTLAFAMIGAFGVGRMTSSHLPYATNTGRDAEDFHPAPAPAVARADELGRFELGSTVIIVAEPGVLEFGIEAGQRVRLGERIGTLAPGHSA